MGRSTLLPKRMRWSSSITMQIVRGLAAKRSAVTTPRRYWMTFAVTQRERRWPTCAHTHTHTQYVLAQESRTPKNMERMNFPFYFSFRSVEERKKDWFKRIKESGKDRKCVACAGEFWRRRSIQSQRPMSLIFSVFDSFLFLWPGSFAIRLSRGWNQDGRTRAKEKLDSPPPALVLFHSLSDFAIWLPLGWAKLFFYFFKDSSWISSTT